MLRDIYIFDLDRTLANISHRAHFLDRKPIPWVDFFARLDQDTVIAHTAAIFHALRRESDYRLIELAIATARPIDYKAGTYAWLSHHGLMPDLLLMRAEGDRRPSHEVKRDIVLDIQRKAGRILLAFDDHLPCVKMYRDLGIPCFHTDDSEEF